MTRLHWLIWLGLVSAPFAACGPDAKPGPACDGPTYNLVLRAEKGSPLPPDTRLNVRYGGNPEGEAYALDQKHVEQAVHCDEDHTPLGGSAAAGAGSLEAGGRGAGGEAAAEGTGGASQAAPSDTDVFTLSCRLYTQGPASIDVTATGYQPIDEQDLELNGRQRCKVVVVVGLKELVDAGM